MVGAVTKIFNTESWVFLKIALTNSFTQQFTVNLRSGLTGAPTKLYTI